MSNLSVAFADDHPLLLEGIAASFRRRAGFTVLGLAANVDDALAVVERTRPDVLSLDLTLRGDAFGAICQINEKWPQTKVVVFTASESALNAVKVLNAGARGYVLKGSTSEELATSIQAVARGEVYITPAFAAKVIAALQADALRPATPPERLSYREGQIIKMLQEGKRNREIAAALNLSEKTIKCYMTTLMQKLHARSRLEVVAALRQGAEAWSIAQNPATNPPTITSRGFLE